MHPLLILLLVLLFVAVMALPAIRRNRMRRKGYAIWEQYADGITTFHARLKELFSNMTTAQDQLETRKAEHEVVKQLEPLAADTPHPEAFSQGLGVVAARYQARITGAEETLRSSRTALQEFCDSLPAETASALTELYQMLDDRTLQGLFATELGDEVAGTQLLLECAREFLSLEAESVA